ncbi:choloylglycine hydrolase family protein [Nordella sp. HKS 07]|uniref:linear amide C-N hydrolase n=1 Tax=Nordella sp. HKS 07 TaxID=2712222 RepID=UPI0013E1D668|nr:choloylglycine hydrolase family protein [Nordella sp. HKS 07]QIG48861.1 choloylglycine hydrolase family protein [Nordella sp. HKS 07]
MTQLTQGKSWRKLVRGGLAMIAATAIATQSALACTSFLLRTTDNGAVYGRTMEFAMPLKSSFIVVPRHYALNSIGADGKPAMTWQSKYAAVGLNALGVSALVDGMNEKGLAGGILYFPDYAGYADPAKADRAKSLAPWDFLTWALTNFATVDEVKAALADISVINVVQPEMGFAPPVHYTLHDASGKSLVIEPVDGVLKVYDNPLGVMTNSPSFDWHLTNLRNYVKLSGHNAPPLVVEGQEFAPLGQGSGLLGIPGDPTPPSRFIRALGYTLSAERKPSGIESVRLAEHILNNFDIPKGWIRDQQAQDAPKTPLEYTQWSTVADLSNKKFYVKTYEDPVLRSIDLMSFDLDAKAVAKATLEAGMTAPALSFAKP